MSFQLIPGTKIDKERWQQLIESSQNDSIYGMPDYLDILCNANWAAVISKDYQLGMVVFPTSKWGMKYTSHPPFYQVSGVFSNVQLTESQFSELMLFLKRRFHFFSVSFSQRPALKLGSLQAIKMDNYILHLNKPYESLKEQYSSTLKRKIRKCMEGRIRGTDEIVDVSAFVEFVKAHFPPVNMGMLRGFTMDSFIKNTIDRGLAGLIVAESEQCELMAGLLYLNYKNRIYLILPVSNELGRQSNAMHFLINHLIREKAGGDTIIDFEGSVLPGVARFYKSFGPELQHYWNIRKPLVSDGFENVFRKARKLLVRGSNLW